MRNRLLLVAVLLVVFLNNSIAQIVGTNVFLKGAYLEIGEQGNGSLGASSSPAGYHPHVGFGTPLAEVYDYGHDGWTVGAPPYMGDYTYPGSPFEGWEVQVNGNRAQGFQGAGTSFFYSGPATMTGSGITSYTSVGGSIRSIWQGTYATNLSMKMETRVDTLASAVVMTVWFHNTGGTPLLNVYYLRSCDPDNDESWPGGSFFTNNVVDYQNSTVPNPTHKVSVTATGTSATHPPLTLCTKDCRAVAFIYNFWPLSSSTDLASIWNQTYGPAQYTPGVADNGDIGIGLVYNLGTIAAGDSAVISYSYVFNGSSGIDSGGALPDPELFINGVGPITSFPDTFDMCSLPSGIDTVPVVIRYGSDKDWTWSHWTWSPAIGLSATTGTSVTVGGSFLTGPTTYTVTGTDSATGMYSCNTRTFVFTIRPCHFAYSNRPCLGDPLRLGMSGDSTGATYYWWGPAGFTSTLHSPVISPTTWADTGTYWVVKTVAGLHDTDFTHVIIHPLPVVNLTSSIAPCAQITSPLNLSASLDSFGETFLWTGPLGFTSTLQNPVINPFDSSMQGTYVCTGTTIWGCKSTSSVNVWPGITPNFSFVMHYGCAYDTVVFTNHSINASTYKWTFWDGSANIFNRDAMHIYNSHQKFPVTLYMTNAHCDVTITDTVNLIHDIKALFSPSPDTICFDGGATVTMMDSSYADDSTFANLLPTTWAWNYGDGTTDVAGGTHTHLFTSPGAFPITLVARDAMGCPDSITKVEYVVQLHIKSFNDTTLCIGLPLALQNLVTTTPEGFESLINYVWTESSPNLDSTNIQIPHSSGVGDFTDVVTMTLPNVLPDACPVVDTVVIHARQSAPLTNVTASHTILYGSSIQLYASGAVIYYWLPNDGSLDNNNINNPVASPTHTTTYTVYGMDINSCPDSAYVTVYVDSSITDGVPGAFSPNGDNLNDVFKPVGAIYQRLVEMRIFNRWGEQVFYTNNRDIGWDGNYKNAPQDMGTYFYEIIVANPGGENKVYKGSFTLIR